jgi:hypothetical protein
MTTTAQLNNWTTTTGYDSNGALTSAPNYPPLATNYAPKAPSAARRPVSYAASNYSADIDQIRYWVGAALTAVIAALVGVIGAVVAHGIVHVPMMVNATVFGLASAGLALVAAALYDGMLHVAPRPTAYYASVAALVTTLATLLPFTMAATLHSQIVMAAMNLGVGLVAVILIPMAAVNARR